MLKDTLLGNTMDKLQESGCSWFFITSSILSIVTGKKNRSNSIKIAEEDERFQQILQQQRENFEDKKDAADKAFKLWLKQKQRDWAREESAKRIENDLNREELRMFFRDWPLQIAIKTINNMRRLSSSNIPMTVIIAKHNVGVAKDPLSAYYNELVDQVQTSLRDYGLDENKINVYRFKEDNKVVGGPALANIYSMMCTLPTIYIQPSIDKSSKSLAITIGCWSQDSFFPFQRKVMELNYDTALVDMDREYLNMKHKEILYAYVTIAMVLNDAYALLEYDSELLFPQFAADHNLNILYPKLVQFAKNEYNALLNPNIDINERYANDKMVVRDYFDHIQLKQVYDKLSSVIEKL